MRPEDKEDDYIEDKENEEIEDINSDTQDNEASSTCAARRTSSRSCGISSPAGADAAG